MNQIIAYLTFNGNCREAMRFYQWCLGGELSLQTIGDSPESDRLPPFFKGYVVHALLKKENWVLMGTDMAEEELSKGNAISILLSCDSDEEIRKCYRKLSEQGIATYPLAETYWGDLFGGLTDKYGNNWILYLKGNTGEDCIRMV